MKHDDRKLDDNIADPVEPEEMLTNNVFGAVAEKALQSALKLASFCSDKTLVELTTAWQNTNSGATCEAMMDPDDDDSDGEGQNSF